MFQVEKCGKGIHEARGKLSEGYQFCMKGSTWMFNWVKLKFHQ